MEGLWTYSMIQNHLIASQVVISTNFTLAWSKQELEHCNSGKIM